MKKPREFHRQRDLVTGELRKKVVECAETCRIKGTLFLPLLNLQMPFYVLDPHKTIDKLVDSTTSIAQIVHEPVWQTNLVDEY